MNEVFFGFIFKLLLFFILFLVKKQKNVGQ